MNFDFYPLRFEFTAKDSLFFPPAKAGNVLRGALGMILRRIACVPDCPGAHACNLRQSCLYSRTFEPAASTRPFVFRARHLDGRSIAAGEPFHFDLHLFTPERLVLACFIQAFASLVREGLGPRRGRAELLRVHRLSAEGIPEQTLYNQSVPMIAAPVQPVSLDMTPPSDAPTRIRVDFLSPTELKHENKIASRPEFPILFGRTRDRISNLRRLYGPGPLDVDYQGTSTRAARVKMTSCNIGKQEAERRSSKTGQVHSIGGFVGTAEYEGDLAEFLPCLLAATWTGVGRQSVWGKGEIKVLTCSRI